MAVPYTIENVMGVPGGNPSVSTLGQGLPSHGSGIVSPGTLLSQSDELEHAGAERVAAPADKPRPQCKLCGWDATKGRVLAPVNTFSQR